MTKTAAALTVRLFCGTSCSYKLNVKCGCHCQLESLILAQKQKKKSHIIIEYPLVKIIIWEMFYQNSNSNSDHFQPKSIPTICAKEIKLCFILSKYEGATLYIIKTQWFKCKPMNLKNGYSKSILSTTITLDKCQSWIVARVD